MRHNYVGDIGDYVKYALLRSLAGPDGDHRFHLGVHWYLTVHDEGNGDGLHIGYLGKPASWQALDPELFEALRGVRDQIADPTQRRLSLVEQLDVFRNDTRFFSSVDPVPVRGRRPGAEVSPHEVPKGTRRIELRRQWAARGEAALNGADLVFFDPDNGIEVRSCTPMHLNADKYVFLDEVAAFVGRGVSAVIYQHQPRMSWQVLLSSLRERLAKELPPHEEPRFITSAAFGSRSFILIPADPSAAQLIDRAIGEVEARARSIRSPKAFARLSL